MTFIVLVPFSSIFYKIENRTDLCIEINLRHSKQSKSFNMRSNIQYQLLDQDLNTSVQRWQVVAGMTERPCETAVFSNTSINKGGNLEEQTLFQRAVMLP